MLFHFHDPIFNQLVIVNARPMAVTVSLGDWAHPERGDFENYTFDRAGRLVGAFVGGYNYRRGLDNRMLQKQEGPTAGLPYRRREWLDPVTVANFLDRMHTTMARLFDAAMTGELIPERPLTLADRDVLMAALDCAARHDATSLQADAARFARIYQPVSILPPDQYLALVLQATEGCSYNQCTFCTFYRDRRFHVKTPAEFAAHIAAVREFMGAGLSLRRSLFLADANALVIPQEQLLPLLDQVNAAFSLPPGNLKGPEWATWLRQHPGALSGIYSFVDVFTGRHKSASDFAALANRGLRRVYVGLETGDDDLLRWLNKPGSAQEAITMVRNLKAGGVQVGVILMLGAGGDRYAASHLAGSVAAIRAMPLDEGDLIYFSELVMMPGSEYARRAKSAGIRALTPEEMAAQMQAMVAGFGFPVTGPAPKIARYDIREFLY